MMWPRTLTIPRSPDFTIGPEDNLYLRRWNVIPRNSRCGLYLHNFLRDDDDRAFHDHQYDNISLIIWGSYIEVTPKGSFCRRAFRPVFRKAEDPHRVMLIDGKPAWSLFFMGKRRREWGFHCPQGWRHWSEFVSQRPGGNEIGKGCD
jgi:hypothetical protein